LLTGAYIDALAIGLEVKLVEYTKAIPRHRECQSKGAIIDGVVPGIVRSTDFANKTSKMTTYNIHLREL
jgi:hypothetical protein